MFDNLAATIATLPLALQLLGLMVVVSAADFAAALIDAARTTTVQGTLLGKWVVSKGLPIISVALLYGLDGAVSIVKVEIGDFDLGLFGALAYAQAITFIAQEGFSILNHLKSKPPEPPVNE